jgi:tetratricopeptide (TPR) repeat protein
MREEERVTPAQGDASEGQVLTRPSQVSPKTIMVGAAFLLAAMLAWNLRYVKFHEPYRQAREFFETGQYEEAIEVLSARIERDPGNGTAYSYRGWAYLEMGEYENAVRDYAKAIERYPEEPSVYYGRGYAYHAMGVYESAIRDYAKAIVLYPEHASAYCCRGSAYFGMGDYESAVRDYTQAIQLRPDWGPPRVFRAYAHGAVGQYYLAFQDIEELIKPEPSSYDPLDSGPEVADTLTRIGQQYERGNKNTAGARTQ